MLLYIENTIVKSFSGFLTELKQLNTLNVPTHDRRHQQRVKELVGQAAGLVKELEQALSNYHTYTEQRTRVYPVDADVDPLSDTNKRLCQHLLENAGHLRPIEQAFRAFHDSLRDDALTTLVRLAIGHVFSIFFRDGMPSLSSSYNISGLVPVCWLLFQCFWLRQAKFQKVDIYGPVRAFF